MLEAYLEILELGYFEVGEAFKGLSDDNVWKRPAKGLLSVGELAGHIAYWEALRLAGVEVEHASLAGEEGKPPDVTKIKVKSPLIDERFSYHANTLATEPSEFHLKMTAAQVLAELLRAHRESVACFKELNPDLNSRPEGWPANWTYRSFVTYLAFHIGYHTGQIYSVRHLLGEETPDN